MLGAVSNPVIGPLRDPIPPVVGPLLHPIPCSGQPLVTSSLGARALTVTPAAGLPAQASWSLPHVRRAITQVAGVDMPGLTGESRYACAATPWGSPASTAVRASVPIEMVPSDPTPWVRSPCDRSSSQDPILLWVISTGGRRYAVSHSVGWWCRLVHAANPEGCGRRSAASPARRTGAAKPLLLP